MPKINPKSKIPNPKQYSRSKFKDQNWPGGPGMGMPRGLFPFHCYIKRDLARKPGAPPTVLNFKIWIWNLLWIWNFGFWISTTG
jgi:hypothetical protein